MTCKRQDQDDIWLFGNATLRWLFPPPSMASRHFPPYKINSSWVQKPAGFRITGPGLARRKRTTGKRKGCSFQRSDINEVKVSLSEQILLKTHKSIPLCSCIYFLKNKSLVFLGSTQTGANTSAPITSAPSMNFCICYSASLAFSSTLLQPPQQSEPHFSKLSVYTGFYFGW